MNYKQNDSHDWLGDAAEDYVRYCFARENFEVFGGGKWSTDCAVRDRETAKWYRVEVKSTDRPKRPIRPRIKHLLGRVDLLAEVVFGDGVKPHATFIKFRLVSINDLGRRTSIADIEKPGDIKRFLQPLTQRL